MQSRNPDNIPGIDVSRHQGNVDWLAVGRDGIQFAYVKATEGVGYTDPMFRRNAVGAPAGGLKVGFYHYCRPETGNTAKQEAQWFADAVNGLPADLPHVLDVEGEAKEYEGLTEWCCAWLTEVERLTGHQCMVYTGASFARSYLGVELAKWPLWVAHYGVSTPMANDTWDRWAVFQYTSSGSVAGIAGNVDRNEMDLEYWRELTGVDKKTVFADVPAGHWAENVVAVVSRAGIMTGYEDGTFQPDKPVTRAELAKVVNDLLYLIG